MSCKQYADIVFVYDTKFCYTYDENSLGERVINYCHFIYCCTTTSHKAFEHQLPSSIGSRTRRDQ
jgi:hypothetical protein